MAATISSLPPPLLAHILSYTIDSTYDYARHRLLNKTIQSVVLPLIPSTAQPKNGHWIKCVPDDVADEAAGSFGRDLVGAPYDTHEESGICAGDDFTVSKEKEETEDENEDEEEEEDDNQLQGFAEEIPLFKGCIVRKILFLGDPKEEKKNDNEEEEKDEEPPAKRTKEGETNVKLSAEERIQKLNELSEKLTTIRNTTKLAVLYNEIKGLSLFEPIRDVEEDEGEPKDEDEENEEDEEDEEWIFHYPAMVTVSVPLDAKCLTKLSSYSTDENLLYLRTSKKTKNEDDEYILFHPRKPDLGAIFPAYIAERKESTVTVRLFMMLRGFVDVVKELLGGCGDIDSILFNNVWEKHQKQSVKEGVAIVDNAITAEQEKDLSRHIDALVMRQNDKGKETVGGVDYHPNSNGVVRDIVHPALYSYVKGVSKLRASVEDAETCTFSKEEKETNLGEEEEEEKNESEDGSKKKADDEDFWGRKYESSKYQWMPTYFNIDKEGAVTISDYINNLVPRDGDTEPLYKSLAKLFQQALPYLESVYGYVRAVRKKMREKGNEVEFDQEGATAPKIKFTSLRNQKLQVITKIVDYELKSGQTHSGVWHVEGMSHEEIVSTVLYVLDRDDDIDGGKLLFKRAFLEDEANAIFSSVPQDRPDMLESIILTGLAPLGRVETLKGRLIVFPNSHVHKVTDMINNAMSDDAENKVSRRRIVVFFIVNPERRIISTREVAPQQTSAGGSMEHEEALNHRLELMKERKFTKQDWNVREIHLCEH